MEPVEDIVLITDADLTDEQRAWTPTGIAECYDIWPSAWKIEMWDGGIQYTNGSGPDWDWKSVVIASRAFPGWVVTLHHGYRLSVRPRTECARQDEAGPPV